MIKTHIIDLDMTKGIKMFPVIKVIRGDVGSNLFLINLTDNGVIVPIAAGDTVTLGFGKTDNIAGAQLCTIVDRDKGQVSVLLPDQATTTAGTVNCELVINGVSPQRKATASFIFECIAGVTDNKAIMSSATGLEILAQEVARALAENERKSNEDTRIANELIRVSNENTRIANELVRVTSEVNRVNAENARISRDNAAILAEEDRQNRFNLLTTLQQQSSEVLNSRTSTSRGITYTSLNDRLESSEIISSPTPPQGIIEDRLWLDESADIYQGTVFDELNNNFTELNNNVNGVVQNIATVNTQLADMSSRAHYIKTTDDPQTIFNNGASGDEFIFVAGEHIHNPVNNNAILYVDKPCTITIPKNAILKIADNSVPFLSAGEIIRNFSNVNIALDDLTVAGSYDNTVARAYTVQIDSVGGVDTFKWNDNFGSATWNAQNVPITGGLQTLANGVQIKFDAVTGHVLNSLWLICYGVQPNYGIRVGTGLQEATIDGFKLKGEGIIDGNRGNNYGNNEYTKLLPSCVLINGRVKNIDIQDVTLKNSARPIQAYGENTGIYNLDGTVTGGVSYDAENISVTNIKQDACGGGSLFGFPEHRGKVKNLYFAKNYCKNMTQLIECNHMLDGYVVENNVFDGAGMSSGLMLVLWRFSKNGLLINNRIINNTSGGIIPITINAPATWQKQTNIVHYNNVNLSTTQAIGTKSLNIGDISNITSNEGAVIIGGENNNNSSLFGIITGGQNNINSGRCSSIAGGDTNAISKDWATISGGYKNTASGDYSNVGGGSTNTASGTQSNVSGGAVNNASGITSVISGGKYNNSSGTASTVTGGQYNTASKNYSRAHGLEAVTYHVAEDVLASGKFSTIGDAQTMKLTMKAVSTSASAVQMDSAGDLLTMIDGQSFSYKINVIAREANGANHAAWKAEGLIYKNTGQNVAILGGVITNIAKSNVSWDFQVIALSSNQSLQLKCFGVASATIRWVATVELAQVQFS